MTMQNSPRHPEHLVDEPQVSRNKFIVSGGWQGRCRSAWHFSGIRSRLITGDMDVDSKGGHALTLIRPQAVRHAPASRLLKAGIARSEPGAARRQAAAPAGRRLPLPAAVPRESRRKTWRASKPLPRLTELPRGVEVQWSQHRQPQPHQQDSKQDTQDGSGNLTSSRPNLPSDSLNSERRINGVLPGVVGLRWMRSSIERGDSGSGVLVKVRNAGMQG